MEVGGGGGGFVGAAQRVPVALMLVIPRVRLRNLDDVRALLVELRGVALVGLLLALVSRNELAYELLSPKARSGLDKVVSPRVEKPAKPVIPVGDIYTYVIQP
jgi:hypothetical protein